MKNITLRIIMFLVIICESAIASDFSDLYDRVSESVVTVVTNQTNKSLSGQNIVSTQQVISGSGVISDANGLVITASHVINLADQVEVYLKNGNIYAAEIIASFPFADIALLRINDPPQDLSVARMGDSDALRIGEEVVIIGAPHGFSQTLTVGHFSGRPENTGSFNVTDTEFL